MLKKQVECNLTFARDICGFWPLTITETRYYWFTIQPVALSTRVIACATIFRRHRARAWWHMTTVWILQWLATNNCKTEKSRKRFTTISSITAIRVMFFILFARRFCCFLTNGTQQKKFRCCGVFKGSKSRQLIFVMYVFVTLIT